MYIQDPLYGGYRLKDEIIKNLLSTFEISRLASVKQANLTSLVFPGANHTRFEHTMGTVYLMDRVFKRLIEKAPSKKDLAQSEKLTPVTKEELEEEAPLMRLVAFLHDMCAFPFSHVIEMGFSRIGPEKMKELENRVDLYVFENYTKGKPYFLNNINHETIRDDILEGKIDLRGYYDHWYKDLHIESILVDTLEDSIEKLQKEGKINFTRKDIVNVYKGEGKYKHKRYLKQLIDGDIDVDRVDHLARDSYYSGIKHAFFNHERLIESMTIEDGDLTISLHMGLPQAVHLMAARELLYDSYYNYSITRAYEAMFCRALYKLLVDDKDFDIDSILFLTDDACLHKLLKRSYDEGIKYSSRLFQRILHRDHLKPIFEMIWPDIRASSHYISEKEVNEMLDTLRYLDKVIDLEAKIAEAVRIEPEELIIYRDYTKDDPRRETRYPDVPVNIWSRHKEGASKDIAHYHHWINDIKEDWKNRWCVRIYTDRRYAENEKKREEIMKAIFKEIPLLEEVYIT